MNEGIPLNTIMMWVLGIGGTLFCLGASAWGRVLLTLIRDLTQKVECLTEEIAKQDILRADRFARIESRQERADEILCDLKKWIMSATKAD